MRLSSWRWTLKDERERLTLRSRSGFRPGPWPWRRGLRTGLPIYVILALLSLGAATPASRYAARTPTRAPRPATELVRIRYWTAPDHTRLVFDLSGPPPVEPQFRLAGPTSYEISIPKMRKSIAVTSEFVGDSLVADI